MTKLISSSPSPPPSAKKKVRTCSATPTLPISPRELQIPHLHPILSIFLLFIGFSFPVWRSWGGGGGCAVPQTSLEYSLIGLSVYIVPIAWYCYPDLARRQQVKLVKRLPGHGKARLCRAAAAVVVVVVVMILNTTCSCESVYFFTAQF